MCVSIRTCVKGSRIPSAYDFASKGRASEREHIPFDLRTEGGHGTITSPPADNNRACMGVYIYMYFICYTRVHSSRADLLRRCV